MERSIEITRIPYEEPHLVNLIFKASNGENSGQLEIYDNADELKRLAASLEDFPFNSKQPITSELGSEDPADRFAFYFKCEFTLLPKSSDCAIEVRLNNNEQGIRKSISHFFIPSTPGELNELGRLFRDFSKLQDPSLKWVNGAV